MSNIIACIKPKLLRVKICKLWWNDHIVLPIWQCLWSMTKSYCFSAGTTRQVLYLLAEVRYVCITSSRPRTNSSYSISNPVEVTQFARTTHMVGKWILSYRPRWSTFKARKQQDILLLFPLDILLDKTHLSTHLITFGNYSKGSKASLSITV